MLGASILLAIFSAPGWADNTRVHPAPLKIERYCPAMMVSTMRPVRMCTFLIFFMISGDNMLFQSRDVFVVKLKPPINSLMNSYGTSTESKMRPMI